MARPGWKKIQWLTKSRANRRTAYGRAIEEAVLSHKKEWPLKWAGQNPLHGGKDFNNMSPSERVCSMLRESARTQD